AAASPEELRDTALRAGRMAASGVPVAAFIPSMLGLPLDEPAFEGRSLRRVSCGGEAMPVELPARFFDRFSGELLNFYGPTETAVDAAFWSCVPEDSRRRSVPIG